MRIQWLLVLMILTSCEADKKGNLVEFTLTTLDKNQKTHKYFGDTISLTLTKNELDKLVFPVVDDFFYEKYMSKDKRFKGLSADFSNVGGPICNQYFYGIVKDNNNTDYRQLLILQVYKFNNIENSLFLLTFDRKDSLISTLEVASINYQPEIVPVFNSKLYRGHGLVKYEITKNNIPEDIDSLATDNDRFLFCTDSITKEFKFFSGQYKLTNKDSLRVCVWK